MTATVLNAQGAAIEALTEMGFEPEGNKLVLRQALGRARTPEDRRFGAAIRLTRRGEGRLNAASSIPGPLRV